MYWIIACCVFFFAVGAGAGFVHGRRTGVMNSEGIVPRLSKSRWLGKNIYTCVYLPWGTDQHPCGLVQVGTNGTNLWKWYLYDKDDFDPESDKMVEGKEYVLIVKGLGWMPFLREFGGPTRNIKLEPVKTDKS